MNAEGIGPTALSVEPEIEQVFIACPDHISNPDDFERKLFVLRNYAAHTIRNTVKQDAIGFYVASLSYKTIVYKGQLTSLQLRHYFPDLSNKRVVSAFGLIHSRFATNTFPSWKLAQPFRFIAHNGEINTLLGNRNWMRAREGTLSSEIWGDRLQELLPIIQQDSSDSGQLDNVLELLTLSGRDLLQSMHMLIPPAWEHNPELDPAQRAECEYHAGMIEPWDGPAALAFGSGSATCKDNKRGRFNQMTSTLFVSSRHLHSGPVLRAGKHRLP